MRVFTVIPILLLCSGCWDLKEINQLAIVNMAGADKNPDTGEITAYYQVINPSALSSRQGSSSKAAVYTYRFENFSMGGFADKTSMVMPRHLFMPHMQSMVVTERFAKMGLTDLVNFFEMNPDRRSNVILLVSRSPIGTVMNSYTPLERMPGRYIRSLTDLEGRGFVTGNEPIRIKDLAKNINRHQPTLLPLIRYTSKQAAADTSRLEKADVNNQIIEFIGGAIIVQGRMEGTISTDQKHTYLILNKKLRSYMETAEVNGRDVDIEGRKIEVDHELTTAGLKIRIYTELRIINNQMVEPLSVRSLRDIEQAFDRRCIEKAENLIRLGREKNWDFLGLQDMGVPEDRWRSTPVTVEVTSKVQTIGNTIGTYQGKE